MVSTRLHSFSDLMRNIVYCTALLVTHRIPMGFDTPVNPLFHVNLNDLDSLRQESSYVACTSLLV